MPRLDELLDEFWERQALAAEKIGADPLPATGKEARLRLEREIKTYGLEPYVVQLETEGYAILPPDFGAPLELTDRIRAAILRVAEERERAHLTDSAKVTGTGRGYFHILPDDPVFEEAVMSPVMLTMVTYLCGYRAKLSTSTALIKTNESEEALHFHTDISGRVPPPWPEIALTANVNWLLTDYSVENGALCVVPGSHLTREPPPPEFRNAHDHPDVKVVCAPAGSLVVWHSGLWHGALPRTAEGKRILMVLLFSRPFYQGVEPYWLTTTKEMIARNPARFGVLTGMQEINPYGRRGPRMDLLKTFSRDLGKWT